MDKVQQDVRATASAVNSTKASLKVQADTTRVAAAGREAAAKINATRAVIPVHANTAPAKSQLAGLQKTIVMKPIMLGMAVGGAAMMRAITQSEEGKKFMEDVDRVAVTVIAPLLQILTPVVRALQPTADQLGRVLAGLSNKIAELNLILPEIRFGGGSGGGFSFGWQDLLQIALDAGTPTPIGSRHLTPAGGGAPVVANTAALIQFTELMRAIAPGLFSGGGIQANPVFNPTARQAPTGWLAALQGMSGGAHAQMAGIAGGAQAGQLAAVQAQFQADVATNQAKVEELTAALAAARAAGWGVAAAEVRLAEATDALARSHALYGAELAKAQAAQAALSRAQRIAAMHADSAALNLAGRSPFQVFQEEMDRLTNLRDMPGSTLNAAGFNTAAAAAFNQLQSTLPQAPTAGPGFLQAGSVEAQAAINAFNRQGGRGTVQEQMLAVLTAARRAEDTTAAGVTEMAGFMRRGVPIVPATRVPRA